MNGFIGIGMMNMAGGGTFSGATNAAFNNAPPMKPNIDALNSKPEEVKNVQNTKVCIRCGEPVTGKFCGNCGTPVGAKKFCIDCGSEVTGNFCTNCGKKA